MADEQTIAGDAEPPPVAGPVEITPTPGARCRILRRRYGDDPMQVFEVAEQVEVLFEQREPLARIRLRCERIDLPFGVDAHRRHLGERGVERARLAAGGIVRPIDARRGTLLSRTGQRAGEDHQDSYHHSN